MGSRARLIKIVQDVRASYWFLPSALVCCAAVFAQFMLWVDANPGIVPFGMLSVFDDTQVDGARAVMSIISQSVFSVAGVMFSMTVVAVTFASGNFGPRLISNFMRDRGNQWSLGILVATFVYCLLITRGIQSGTAADSDNAIEVFVPHFSIALAFVATFLSIFTVIYFVHHIPETINVSNITASLGRRLQYSIKELIEDHLEADGEAFTMPDTKPDNLIRLSHSGYLQTLNKAAITQIADDNDLIIDVPFPPGEFVTPEAVVLRVWGDLSESDAKNLQDAFALGLARTEHQNLLFIVDQLVEMIARALSPGINDPYTAINCLNWLHAALSVAATHKGGLKAENSGRVISKSLTFEDILNAAVVDPLPYIADDHLASAHLRTVLAKLKAEVRDTPHATSVAKVAAMLND